LGALMIWPRYLVLIMYVTMLFVYAMIARWEEERCAQQFNGYRLYKERTGRFWPRRFSRMHSHLLPRSGGQRAVAFTIYAVVIGAAVVVGHQLREYSLSCVSSLYTQNMAVLSPAVLTSEELSTALHVAMADDRVQERLAAAGRAVRLLVYIVPMEWNLPDLPLEVPRGGGGGHHMPGDFERRLYKVLFSKVRTHD